MMPRIIYWTEVLKNGKIRLYRQDIAFVIERAFGLPLPERFNPDPHCRVRSVECYTWEEIGQHLKDWTLRPEA